MAFYEEIGMDFRIKKKEYKQWPKYSEAHFHECHELYYLIEGSVYYCIDDEKYTINAGEVVFLPMDISHKTRPNSQESYKCISLYVSPDYVKKFLDKTSDLHDFFYKLNIIKLNSRGRTVVEFILNKMLNEYNKKSELNESYINAYLTTLFLTLNDYSCSQSTNEVQLNKSISPVVMNITKYINTHFSDEITLSSLAQEFYLHPSYISNLIKKNLGVTFVEYLNRVRIQKSLKLLQTTERKIEDIAGMCGFNSGSHYTKVFVSYWGTPPSQYRKLKQTESSQQPNA